MCLQPLFDCSLWRQFWRSTLKLGFRIWRIPDFHFEDIPRLMPRLWYFTTHRVFSRQTSCRMNALKGVTIFIGIECLSLNQFLGQEVFAFHSCCTYPQAHKFYYIQDLVPWVFQTECDSVKVAIVGVLRSFDWDNTFQSLVSCKVASCFNSFENMPPWEIWRSVLEKRL